MKNLSWDNSMMTGTQGLVLNYMGDAQAVRVGKQLKSTDW